MRYYCTECRLWCRENRCPQCNSHTRYHADDGRADDDIDAEYESSAIPLDYME